MVRKTPGLRNKLLYHYAGPYRVAEALGGGRYRLRDQENRMLSEEVHVTNLRPYYTLTDDDPLQSDEHLVEALLDRKGRGQARHYLVKWRGYPRSAATWEPLTELLRRCADLVTDYDNAHPPTTATSSQTDIKAGPITAFSRLHRDLARARSHGHASHRSRSRP